MRNVRLGLGYISVGLVYLTPKSLKAFGSRVFPRWERFVRRFYARRESSVDVNAVSNRMDLNRLAGSLPLTTRSVDGAPNILLYTPYAPSRNGIGNYSRLLSQEISKTVNLGIRVSGQKTISSLEPGVYSASWDDTYWFTGERLFMLGNGPEHLETWQTIHRLPGHVLLHDPRIQDIPLLPTESDRWSKMTYSESINSHAGRIPETMKTIIVHSVTARDILLEQFRVAGQDRENQIRVLKTGHPFPETRTLPRKLSEHRRAVVGTLGFQTDSKLPELTYSLMSEICSITGARGVICGEITDSLSAFARKTWSRWGNSPGDLDIIGNASDVEFEKLAESIDLGIQLRSKSNGESSGPVSYFLANGSPVIVSNLGSFSEIQTEAVVFFSNTSSDRKRVVTDSANILGNRSLFEALSSQALSYARERSFAVASTEILEILEGARTL